MILLDTDILTHYLAGHEGVRRRVVASEDPDIAVPIVGRIEVLRGRFDSVLKAADGAQAHLAVRWLETIERGLEVFPVAPITEASAEQFDLLRQNRKLRKIGNADLLIASIALANTATLVTRNLRHFGQIPQLRVENWAD